MDPEKKEEQKVNPGAFAAPDGTVAPETTKEEPKEPTPPPEGGEWKPSPLWDDLKSNVEGFEMPEVTKENEEKVLKDLLVKHGLAEPAKPEEPSKPDNKINDPEYEAYLQWKQTNPTGSLEDFVAAKTAQQKILSLNGAEFMKEALYLEYGKYDEKTNPNGLTEEQVDDYVNALEENKTLPMEVIKRKRDLTAKQQQAPTQPEGRSEEAVQVLQDSIEKMIEAHSDEVDVFGTKLSKAEVEKVNNYIKDISKPDDKGEIKLVKLLDDDNTLWRFLAFSFLGEEKIKGKVFEAKDSAKEEIFKRLGLTPKIDGKQSAPANKNVLTPSKWSVPEEK